MRLLDRQDFVAAARAIIAALALGVLLNLAEIARHTGGW